MHDSLFNDVHFVANDPLKLNKVITTCLIYLNIYIMFFRLILLNDQDVININSIVINRKIIYVYQLFYISFSHIVDKNLLKYCLNTMDLVLFQCSHLL